MSIWFLQRHTHTIALCLISAWADTVKGGFQHAEASLDEDLVLPEWKMAVLKEPRELSATDNLASEILQCLKLVLSEWLRIRKLEILRCTLVVTLLPLLPCEYSVCLWVQQDRETVQRLKIVHGCIYCSRKQNESTHMFRSFICHELWFKFLLLTKQNMPQQ